MTYQEAIAIIHSLSKPSKMPCHGYSLSAFSCKTGSALSDVVGSVCEECYAKRHFYRCPSVKRALDKRMAAFDHPRFAEAMAVVIRHREYSGFWRWFDSGDVQNIIHFGKIVRIAELRPDVKFWLPTKEYAIVRAGVAKYGHPANLSIRLSAYMVDGPAPKLGFPTATVTRGNATCPAPKQGGKCLSCRACWDSSVVNVSYGKH